MNKTIDITDSAEAKQDFCNALIFDKLNAGGRDVIPAVIRNMPTGEIRMVGVMNREALEQTLLTGFVTFFSRSKGRLWQKGEQSGNTLRAVRLRADCDSDTVLIDAVCQGPTCHTGEMSCFGDVAPTAILQQLEEIIASRSAAAPGDSSYTARLLQDTPRRRAQKVGEEGVETALALSDGNDAEVISESADLLYHLLVALAGRNIRLDDVLQELRRRRNTNK